jgi:hypothetical protein
MEDPQASIIEQIPPEDWENNDRQRQKIGGVNGAAP